MKTRVITERPEKHDLLRELGLDEEELREVLRLAEVDAATCTEFDPPGNEGHTRWASGTRYFRLSHASKGWRVSNNSGLAATVHPEGDFQVVVATGDSATGDPLAMPKTKNPRGPATQAAITENVVQLDLFFASGVPVELNPKAGPGLVTRFLLVHRSASEIRAELSVPADMQDGGKVDAFTERIILDPVPLDSGPSPKRFDEGEGVDVPVRRKRE